MCIWTAEILMEPELLEVAKAGGQLTKSGSGAAAKESAQKRSSKSRN